MRNLNEPLLRIRNLDYKKFGLKANPFPISGITADHTPYPLIDRGMDDEIHNFIDDTLRGQEYGGLVILGDFGSGKTYALRYVETLLRTIVTRPDAEEILAIYVEKPPRTVLGLIADVCNRIGRVRIKNFLREMILADLANEVLRDKQKESDRMSTLRAALKSNKTTGLFDFQLSELVTPNAVMNSAATFDVLRQSGFNPKVLLNFATESLSLILKPKDSRTLDIASHLAEFALADDKEALRLWNHFLAGRVWSGGQQVALVSGQAIWMHLLILLRRAGYKMIYWLIDEFEELDYHHQKELEVRAFLSEFRDLIDANLRGFGLVLASKVSAWDICKRLNPAFAQRFSRIVLLPPNSFEDLRRLIEVRLKAVREKDYSGNPLSPFTDAAIQALEKVSLGNTRVAVEACHVLLWHVASTNEQAIEVKTIQNLNNINRAYLYAREGIAGDSGA